MSELTDLQTIRDMVRWAVSRFNEAGLFYGHGSDTAWDEAVTLVLRSLYLPHDINPTVLDARLTSTERTHLQRLIHRRVDDRIPVAYLIQEAWFAGLPYFVDERVLIPRSPIAEMIENEFSPWLQLATEEVQNILDLCTGSGCIAIACAKAFPDAIVDASDISTDALTVAKMNVLRHGVEDQVNLLQSNLFDDMPKKKYDIIVSNPPYVDAEDMASLPNEYRHEPALALEAGPKGLDFAIRIMRMAPEYLTPEGVLIVEVGNSEYALADAFPEIPFMWIEFQRGGGGVFLLTAQQLKACQPLLSEI
jgi:ribosomal protein L3 glutamine methyltransferase